MTAERRATPRHRAVTRAPIRPAKLMQEDSATGGECPGRSFAPPDAFAQAALGTAVIGYRLSVIGDRWDVGCVVWVERCVCCIRCFATVTTLGTGGGAYALSSSRGVSTHDPCTVKTISSNNQKVSNGNQDVTSEHRKSLCHTDYRSRITDHGLPIAALFRTTDLRY